IPAYQPLGTMVPVAFLAPPIADRNAAPWSGPAEAARIFGVKCCCMSAFMIAWTPGTSGEPMTTMSGFIAAIASAPALYAGFSAGKILEYTVLMPAFTRIACAFCTIGTANGSVTIG